MLRFEITESIIMADPELGHSLGLKVVAEGVENQEIFDKLNAIGCDVAQGYFMSKPIPQEELMAWLSKKSAGS